MKRKICYVSGTRADFGLMRTTLAAIDAHEDLDLSVIVTGMHLSECHGHTIDEIERAGLRIAARLPVDIEAASGIGMAQGIGTMTVGIAEALDRERPDIVLLLGDRGEMLAGAIAAIHLNIVIAHVHGGERSGTVDEPVRHAISKLSHLHLPATRDAGARLLGLGEQPNRIFVVGAPGLDGLTETTRLSRVALAEAVTLEPDQPIALMLYHPVLQQSEAAGPIAEILLDALFAKGFQVVALMPNADSGSAGIRNVLERRATEPQLRVATHFERAEFVSWMAAVDVMIGNSSSGIIEAASFGTPVVNVGARQNLRERNGNVIDAGETSSDVEAAIQTAMRLGRQPAENVYGDGKTAERVARLMATVTLGPELMMKSNAF